jgi:hypothetical protein
MIKSEKVTISLMLFLSVLACKSHTPNWPEHVLTNMLVPVEAKEVSYYMIGPSYQVKYEMNECYPATGFINEMVRRMTNSGWKRLDYDYLNPKVKLHHARAPDGLWGILMDRDGTNVNQWFDDWEDPRGNIMRYILRYRRKESITEKTCNLDVYVIYVPRKSQGKD